MSVINLAQQHAIWTARMQNKEALMSWGEEVIFLATWHPGMVIPDGVARCHCFDDVYQQGDVDTCRDCYGTTYMPPIRNAWRGWAVFTVKEDEEVYGKKGTWLPVPRKIEFEAGVDMYQHDFFFRVTSWTPDHKPLRLGGAHIFGNVVIDTLHTGVQVEQTGQDTIGQWANCTELSTEHPIYNYPIPATVVVPRLDGLER